ncbi:unnamed protein product [Somion occarium]|uniref:MARVEL domain-containing protein n=1 Tax=Somion occarium TaxID=3059160 RepID=A0ABP1D045_9APHY
MKSFTKGAIAAYSLLLSFSLFEVIFAILYFMVEADRIPFQATVGWVLCGFSAVTFVWSCVLVATVNRPRSTHPLCTVKAHYFPLFILSVIWIGSFILFRLCSYPTDALYDFKIVLTCLILKDAPRNCNPILMPDDGEGIFCGFAVTVSLLAFSIFVISTTMAPLIYIQSKKYGIRNNIASLDSAYRHAETSQPENLSIGLDA